MRSILSVLLFAFVFVIACSGEPDVPSTSSSGTSSSEASASDTSAGESSSSSESSGSSQSSTSQSASSGSSSSANPNASIYISEYVEGNGNNKYIELYNPRSTPFSLSGWSIRQYNNGNEPTVNYIFNLTGSIPAGGVVVIARNLASEWKGTPNMNDNGNTMNFSGNDAVGLFNGSDRVDIVGVPGSNENIIMNMTLVRRPGKGPSATFDIDDWYRLDADTVSNLGQHDPVNGIDEPSSSSSSALPVEYPHGAAGSDVFISEYFDGANSDKYIEVYNGTIENVDLSEYRLVRIDINSSGETNAAASYCMQLEGTLYPGDVLVIVHGGYNTARLSNIANMPTALGSEGRKIVESPTAYPNGICFFGGNDPVYLVKNGAVIDVVGHAATEDNWGSDKIWIRGEDMRGSLLWDEDEWMDDDLILEPGNSDAYLGGADFWGGWHQP